MVKASDEHNKGGAGQDQNIPTGYHAPVLLSESIEGLQIKPDGIYVDCTFGGGGHSKEILKRMTANGRLFAFDQDADALEQVPNDARIVFIPHNFRHLKKMLRLNKIEHVDGILADLGVSSHQFDEAERGFSTRLEGNLDMRMDKRQSLTAGIVLNTYDEQALKKLFEEYGEVTNSKTLAREIVQIRTLSPLKTINGFKQAIHKVVKGNSKRYFAQVFQALRIEVNDELGALKEMLKEIPSLLNPGGRAVIISFHSLEDRIVKNFFRKNSFAEEDHSNPFGQETVAKTLRVITKKPIVPTEAEIRKNNRSRSALLRIAEKTNID
ncbi:MAG: 16S rRNA (cytosine(1402)-N(4))-methyltransferase RsmH [Chitinophagales bacterium]